MKISGWNIDGFGILHDYEVRDLPQGLTVFHGANEAGKSTLLAFLRGMLFGFPDRRAPQERYLPANGGRHGGRLTIEVGDQSLLIDRDASRKSSVHVGRSDGRSGSLDDLTRALAGTDDQLYRSVFAFGLSELQTFESLTVDGIRDRIFTAGVAGAGRSARAVIETLEERARTLLRRSSRARITGLVAELTRVREALDAARAASGHYRDRLAEEQRCAEDTHQLADALREARREREAYALLIELWPLWRERCNAQAERDGLGRVVAPPADAEVRLAAVNESLRAARRTAESIETDLVRARSHQDELERQRDGCADLHMVERFHAALPLRRDRLRALEIECEHLRSIEADFAARFAMLGPGWDEAHFAGVVAQPPALDEVRFWERQLAAAGSARERALAEHQRTARRLADVIAERDRIRRRLPDPQPPSLAVLEERDAAIRRLRANIVDLRAAQSDAEASDRVAGDGTQALRAFEATTSRIDPRIATVLCFVVLVLGGAIAGWRESLTDRQGALLAGGITGALLLMSALFRRWAVRREQQRRERVASIVAEIEEAMRARESYRARGAALRSAINVDRDALALKTLSYGAIDEEDTRLQRQRAARARWDEISTYVTQIESTVDAAQRADRDAADQRVLTERAASDADAGWREWLHPSGLFNAETPAEVVALLANIDMCREVWLQREAARDRVANLRADIAAWETDASAFIARADPQVDSPHGDACLETIERLHQRWVRERARADAHATVTRELTVLESRQSAAEKDLLAAGAARTQLFCECGASDEDEFRGQLDWARRAAQLESVIADADRQIAARAGARGESVRSELATGAVAQWESQRARIDGQIDTLDSQRDEAVRRHHDACRVRLELEGSAAVATLEGEHEALRAELDAAVDEWRVTTAARALIEETLREFERSRQPAVLAEAGRVLTTVTGGRYTRVLQDDDQIVVTDPSGARKGPGQLSRGTVEQLYLCVRLGLAAELGRRSARLPVIMDDVLVNFDPDRARALARALADFAEEHQVLFFTCQPATRDLLVEVGRAARVVEMGSNGAHSNGALRPSES